MKVCTATENAKNCNCTYPCSKKGICCECISYHRRSGELPACYFSPEEERSYDRSVSFYIQSRKK
ncbi:DUF6485 family protein [Brucepastera parasyntrophica]|uniref:DUF6485 family protein n=1 Tax=Brucepastera parasyntrophica TaxID=2880008 RepID=UPI003F72AA07